MKGYKDAIENLTLENNNFRKVLYTTHLSQLVLMCLKPSEEIGEEVHGVDQFFRLEKGSGEAVLDGVSHKITEGDVVIVPAGTKHNIINTSESEPLKLYTLYSPPNHQDGLVHTTKTEAESKDKPFDGKITEQ